MKLSFRTWLTIGTLALLTIVVIFAWPEIRKAWHLLGQVNLWILFLLIPVQLASYYATGGMIFSYLRSKGDLQDMSHWSMARLALELNFVNHILPSGGAAGFSYLAWVLSRHKVAVARSTMAQIIRFALTFIAFVVIMVLALLILTLNQQINRLMVAVGILLVVMAILAIFSVIWLVSNRQRLARFSEWLTKKVNHFVAWVTRGRKKTVAKQSVIFHFFEGLHDDYLALRRDRRVLIRPFLWAAIANVLDAALIWIAFWSLGYPIDGSLLFVAFGVASILSAISVTPGGAGVYEAVMVAFLAASGITPDVAIAGTLLARVTLLTGTILFGYIFYQLTVLRYGKHTVER
ncbi:MAG TPA: lysylphosphatidylglycerol synthase transmembrane domain-containing protein [Dongiaceae bacterium]|nr:lysylphosphatidylglycerol synthase transmembrane domain-containing protein [Dongiaceae bacterium]